MSSVDSSGENLMLNKPSKQSSTVFQLERANDGLQWTYNKTELEQNPVWQGDLLARYVIERITIISPGFSLDNAYVGISDSDKFIKPDSEVIVCGQWPVSTWETLSFFCNDPRPMRYVRIWANHSFQLYIGEVVVKQMVGSSLKGMKMNSIASKRVYTVMTSLQVNSSTECANACFVKQHCGAFSFSRSAEDNCLLTSSGIMLTHGSGSPIRSVTDHFVLKNCSLGIHIEPNLTKISVIGVHILTGFRANIYLLTCQVRRVYLSPSFLGLSMILCDVICLHRK